MLVAVDCEGPLTKNDNALELSMHFIPKGERLFTQLSRYDDILAFMLKRPGYRAGNTLKLICPFFRAFGIKNKDIMDFSESHILIMPGAETFLMWMKDKTSCVIISTSYTQYIQSLCRIADFPIYNTFSTDLDLDFLSPSETECLKVRAMADKIVSLPFLDWEPDVKSINGLHPEVRDAFNIIDDIITMGLEGMEIGEYLKRVEPVGGIEKAIAVKQWCKKNGQHVSGVIYIGDSITDVEAFRMVREAGGITVAFNGNRYAIEAAEIACLAHHSDILRVICQIFDEQGRDGLIATIVDWQTGSSSIQQAISHYHPGGDLLAKETRYPSYFTLIKENNLNDIIVRSETLRGRIRGKEIGRLG